VDDNFDVTEFLTNFIGMLQNNYGQQRDILQAASTQNQVKRQQKPVSTGRQRLLDAHRAAPTNKSKARILLTEAVNCLDSGAVIPDASEWPIDGPEVGRGHACMWGGIVRTFTHKQNPEALGSDATLADAWFGTAALIFLTNGETTMAGRSVQEWAESRLLLKDSSGAQVFFLASVGFFALAGESERAQIAGARASETTPGKIDSSFFLGRPPTEEERKHLTTVIGGKNSNAFYQSLK